MTMWRTMRMLPLVVFMRRRVSASMPMGMGMPALGVAMLVCFVPPVLEPSLRLEMTPVYLGFMPPLRVAIAR